MKIIKKILRLVLYISFLFIAKMKWRKSFVIKGLFRKRFDTEIIIQDKGYMQIGANVNFQKRVALTSVGGNLIIENNVSFNRNCIVICRNNIFIGSGCMLGPGVTVYDHDHKFNNKEVSSEFNTGNVVIEKGCWIGANVVILRNTHIGEGSIIGAGTVVKGDIPAHSLVTSDRKLNITTIIGNKEEKVYEN